MHERFQIPIARSRFLGFLGRGLLLLLLLFGCGVSPVRASAIARLDATEVSVSLGSSTGELKFFPIDLSLSPDEPTNSAVRCPAMGKRG